MTHTLHRRGTPDSLQEDYIILMTPAQEVNVQGSLEKIRQVWEVISHYEPHLVNFGNSRDGNRFRTNLRSLRQGKYEFVHAVFKDRETFRACLQELKDRDFGISVVVTGPYDEVRGICREVGLKPHTVAHSLGIHGRRERLPEAPVLEITTMCGHGIVSPSLVREMIQRIEQGKMTYRDAANELSRVCDCGVFNPHRAERLLRNLTSNSLLKK